MRRYYRRKANTAKSEFSKIVHKEGSDLEREFETMAIQIGLPPYIREYKFMRTRRFKFDFAWPDLKISVEIEGGVGMRQGHHVNVAGYNSDCEKYNYAAIAGWKVLRFTKRMLKNGKAIEQLGKAFHFGT